MFNFGGSCMLYVTSYHRVLRCTVHGSQTYGLVGFYKQMNQAYSWSCVLISIIKQAQPIEPPSAVQSAVWSVLHTSCGCIEPPSTVQPNREMNSFGSEEKARRKNLKTMKAEHMNRIKTLSYMYSNTAFIHQSHSPGFSQPTSTSWYHFHSRGDGCQLFENLIAKMFAKSSPKVVSTRKMFGYFSPNFFRA